MNFQFDIDSLVSNWNYTRTAQYNGRKASKGRQTLEVVDAALVPADYPNKQIAASAIVEGKRGARYSAHIYRNGFISVLN